MITPEENINTVHLAIQIEEKPVLRHTLKKNEAVTNIEGTFVHHTIRDGLKIPVFDRIRVTCYGDLAEEAVASLKVGDAVLVSGLICRKKTTERDSEDSRPYFIEGLSLTRISSMQKPRASVDVNTSITVLRGKR